MIEELVSLTTKEPSIELDERVRFKYPNIACELLTSDVPAINEKLASEEVLLDKLYSFLEGEPPLNPLLASYFSRIVGVLITKKTEQVCGIFDKWLVGWFIQIWGNFLAIFVLSVVSVWNITYFLPSFHPLLFSFYFLFSFVSSPHTHQNWLSYQFTCLQVLVFLKAKDNFISLLLKHLGTSAIMDLMLKLMTQVESVEMRQNILNVSNFKGKNNIKWDLKKHFSVVG